MTVIALDADWRYFPTEIMDAAYGVSELDVSSWGVLDELSGYPRDLIAVTGTLNLRRTFDLEPMGSACVRIHLHCTIAPADTAIFINGWQVGVVQAGQPLDADITDFVSLEDNLILLKVSRRGDLRALTLERVLCGQPQ